MKKRYFGILLMLAVFLTMTSISAVNIDGIDMPGIVSKNVKDAQIVGKGSSQYIVVNVNENVKYSMKTDNINKVNWTFGDGSKKVKTESSKDSYSVTHKYTRVGTYKVKVSMIGSNDVVKLNKPHTEQFVVVKVVKKADLIVSSYKRYIDKSRNVVYIKATIKNKGAVASVPCSVKVWYSDAKLSKYAKTMKIKGLNPGKTTNINIYFKIPVKYASYVKNIKVDYTNKVTESIKSNNLVRFK